MSKPGVGRLLELCQEALAREGAERERFLGDACAGDRELRAAVDALLAGEADTGGLLETPAWTPHPKLAPGSRLGPYEVESFVGAGGMGEVYKARDTRLDRTVAVKVLPPAFASHGERRARFELEAKTIAGLNHPNVCTLYDVGEERGSMFLVMEFIDGETLASRLREGPLPVDEALRIAVQIADAIAVAHARGISHRDLKPANVMLARHEEGGRGAPDVKLLDFGLAKLGGSDLTNAAEGPQASPAGDQWRTEAGRIVGTVPYMSPEQIEGRRADVRSDIFSFGALFYEMLTGKRAFAGRSPASVITAILQRQPPPPSALQPLASRHLDQVVRKCLAKDPDQRWQSATELAAEVRHISGATGPPAARLRRRLVQAAAVVVLLFLGGGAVLVGRNFLFRPRIQLIDVRPAASLSGASPHEKLTGRPSSTALAISRDGRTIYFSAARGNDAVQIYARSLRADEATPVPGTEGGDAPFLSPDDTWLGFHAGNAWRKVPVSGGRATDITTGGPTLGSASWADDGRILLGGMQGIEQVDAKGAKTLVTKVDRASGEICHVLPQLLPGGSLVYTAAAGNALAGWRVKVRDATGHARTLVQGAADARYVPTGHLVYVRGGRLCARPFDVRTLAFQGPEVTLADDVMQTLNDPDGLSETGASQMAISASGTLILVRGGVFPDGRHVLAWLSRNGTIEPLDTPMRSYIGARLSPDGKRAVLFTMGSLQASSWIYDMALRNTAQLAVPFAAAWPMWSRDGGSIVVAGLVGEPGSGGMFRVSVDTPGPPVLLQNAGVGFQWPSSWVSDGRELVYVQGTVNSASDIWAMPAGQPEKAFPLVQTPGEDLFPAVSPDSRWLAYTTKKPGGPQEVYIRPYRTGEPTQLSKGGGRAPAWSPDGRKLYWVSTGVPGAPLTFYCVDVLPGRQLALGNVETWYREGGVLSNFALPPARVRGYDVASDGRLLIVWRKERPPVARTKAIEVVENWFAELKAKAPVPQ